jgi:GxxExxY protein
MATTDDIESAAEEVFDTLGDGHSEAVYHRAMERELSERGISFSSEGTIPIFYKGSPVGRRRPDMFITDGDETIVIELKAKSRGGHEQLSTYKSLLDSDDNYDIDSAMLIQFGDGLYVES